MRKNEFLYAILMVSGLFLAYFFQIDNRIKHGLAALLLVYFTGKTAFFGVGFLLRTFQQEYPVARQFLRKMVAYLALILLVATIMWRLSY